MRVVTRYPSSDMRVSRRFRDFEWLHERLQLVLRRASASLLSVQFAVTCVSFQRVQRKTSCSNTLCMFLGTISLKSSQVYHGLILPPLPPKRLWNKNDGNFVTERMEWLNQYMRHLGRNPTLWTS